MATTKVSALTETTSPQANDELLINQSGVSKKVKITNLPAGLDTTKLPLAGGTMTGNIVMSGSETVDGVDISARDAVLTSTTTTANAALPKAGGEMTGNITMAGSQTVDGRDLSVDGTKLDGVEASADVTDATNVTAAGALMDSEVTNLAQVKAFDSSDYATAAQGTTADAALPKAGGSMTGNIVMADDTSIGIADNAERIEFDGAGDIGFLGCNVGIGTSTVPTSPENNAGPILQIGDGSNAMSSIVLHEDGNKWEIVSNNDLILQDESVVRLRLAQAGDITFNDASQAALVTIKNAGDVGIGTTSPAATLEVDGNAIAKTDTDTSNTGSVTLDFGANQNFVLTLTGNVTLANPSTEVVGQSGFITFIQDGTGSRTVSLGTDYETAGGAGLTLTSTASATDIVPYVVVASGRILLGTPQLAFA